jgi:hypothetical protein
MQASTKIYGRATLSAPANDYNMTAQFAISRIEWGITRQRPRDFKYSQLANRIVRPTNNGITDSLIKENVGLNPNVLHRDKMMWTDSGAEERSEAAFVLPATADERSAGLRRVVGWIASGEKNNGMGQRRREKGRSGQDRIRRNEPENPELNHELSSILGSSPVWAAGAALFDSEQSLRPIDAIRIAHEMKHDPIAGKLL